MLLHVKVNLLFYFKALAKKKGVNVDDLKVDITKKEVLDDGW